VTLAAYAAAAATAVTALARSVPELAALRLLAGATAAVVFPLAFAWVGDMVAYEKRQVILARIFGGAMLGAMVGQAVSGIFADFLGWRAVFVLAGAIFSLAAIGLTFEGGLRRPPVRHTSSRGIVADLLMPFELLKRREPKYVLGVSATEGFFVMSATTFLGAYLHDRFDLSFSQIGIALAAFGAGGLFYTLNASWIIRQLGEIRLVTYGGLIFSALFLAVAFTPVWQTIPVLMFAGGASLLMLHNTLQLRASQMAPDTRGAAMSAFAASFFVGQLGGIAVGGPLYDKFGGPPLIAAGAIGFALVTVFYRTRLKTLNASA
jgi:predicted MFS family arabinose efflux permease